MATEKRLDLVEREAIKDAIGFMNLHFLGHGENKSVLDSINEVPSVDAVEVPCKIGDFVWAIRNFKGKKHPQRGIVSDMYFLKDMSLQIVVKYVARGKWGETVFATDKEAYADIGERKDNE